MKKASSLAGYTLIEILVCLSIIGLLLVLALPLSLTFLNKNHAERVEEEIRAALHYARNIAYKNDRTLTLVPLRRNPEKDKDWSQGMVLYRGEKMIHQWEWPYKNIRVSWKGFRSNEAIVFSTILRQSTANGYFLISTQDGYYQNKLIVNRLGHITRCSN